MSDSAAPPPDPAPAAPVEERHVSAVAGSKTGMTKMQGAVLVLLGAGALVAIVLLRPDHSSKDAAVRPEDATPVRPVTNYEPPPPPPRPAPTPASLPVPHPQPPPPPPNHTLLSNPFKGPEDPLAKARHAALLAYGGVGPGNPGAPPAGPDGGGPARPSATGPSEMAARLQATPVSAVSASVLPHQGYLLTKGHTLPCVLQTAIDSTLPGFVTCKLDRDYIGKTGITLLDRGTLVTGETRGGLQQGENRLFVLWTRAETPNGVIINLDSPAVDPVGRSGFDGEVDTHFFARLGGALLLTVVQGALQTGVAAASPQGSTNINTGAVESVASESLRNSVNIRPTLRKNQGEVVGIYVARDLDFSTVYSVATVSGTGRSAP